MDQRQITENAIQDWLESNGPKSGNQEVSSRILYEKFLTSNFCRELLMVPTLKKFTIELSKSLPRVKTASGTVFFCEVLNESVTK